LAVVLIVIIWMSRNFILAVVLIVIICMSGNLYQLL